MSRDEYLFVKSTKNKVKNISLLIDILDAISKGYFHYKRPLSYTLLNELASDNLNKHYRQFYIRKRNGGKRIIYAPDSQLKEIQNCIRILLSGVRYRGKSIVDNAEPHIGKDIVYNTDIKDFYSSINALQIISALLKLNFDYDAACFISSLVTIRSEKGIPVLPQGSPTSPIIAEIVVKDLDKQLKDCASKYNAEYTRYADDITFSCSKTCPWRALIKEFNLIITNYGFTLNNKKSRISFYYQRQEVTGIVVNKKLNTRKNYIKILRTIIHNWEVDGYIQATNKYLMNYYKNLSTLPQKRIPRLEQVIAGKLSYLKMVRHYKAKDCLWNNLYRRYKNLIKRDKELIKDSRRI